MTRLPMAPAMERGRGNRLDNCERYTTCLDAFVRADPLARSCQCPAECGGYVARSFEDLASEAMRLDYEEDTVTPRTVSRRRAQVAA